MSDNLKAQETARENSEANNSRRNRSEPFVGTGTALVTPFFEDGTIDYASFDRLVATQINAGIEALVVCGSTGESATLTYSEKLALIERTVALADAAGEAAGEGSDQNGTPSKRPHVIAGTGSNVTSGTIELTTEAAALGVDAALLVSPYYSKPTQRAICHHYGLVAAGVPDLPIILYNVPGRTGSNMSAETTLRLARDHDNIVGIKEASGDIDQACTIIREAPEDFLVYSGEDSLTLPLLSIGARGVIAVVGNEVPNEFGSMVRSALAGDFETARRLHLQLSKLMGLNFIESNPVPVKEALAMMGVIASAHFRRPLERLDDAHRETLRTELAALGLLEQIESPADIA